MTDAVQNLVAALAAGQVEVVDLTQPLSEETPILPPEAAPEEAYTPAFDASLEPAAAVPLAAWLAGRVPGDRACLVLCGANT